MIPDVRSNTRDAGTDNDKVTNSDPRVTRQKALVASGPVFQGKGRVQSRYLSNPTIKFKINFVQKWSNDP